MTMIRSAKRWGSLIGMVVGAAVSVGITAVVAACGGDAETEERRTGDAGAKDGEADASDATSDSASDGADVGADAILIDHQLDIVPTDDVSLDTVPAE